MAIEIINDGASLRIVNKGSIILINKLHIKSIETVRNDVVRLDIGDGTLKNVYIKFAEVAAPAGLTNAAQLRDAINAMLKTDGSGLATAELQQSGNTTLESILKVLGEIKIILSNLKCGGNCQEVRIDDSNPLSIYYGVAAAGSGTGQPVWSIRRESRKKENDIVIVEWADGNELFDNVWDQRLDLFYSSEVVR